MIILRSRFYSSEEEGDVKKNNKDLAKALGIAGGSAALGAGGGYGFNKIGKKLLDKKGKALANITKKLGDEYDQVLEDLSAAKKIANSGENAEALGKKIVEINEQLSSGSLSEDKFRSLKENLENNIKPEYRENLRISRNKELVEEAKKSKDKLREEFLDKRRLLKQAEKKEEKFIKGLPSKLKRNKKLAWGVGLGTTALGSLGAYEYYKNKKKKK